MFRFVFLLFLSLSFLNSNENVVKTSELELFLFKVGFESLLKDVDLTKDKSSLNEKEIKNINEKIELIMAELYKNNRVLLNDSQEDISANSINSKELQNLKSEIAFLKSEINKLKEVKKQEKKIAKSIVLKKPIEKLVIKKDEKNTEYNSKLMRVATDLLAVYKTSNTDAEVIRRIERNSIIEIENCNAGWCKLKNENHFVRRFLIKPWKK